LIATDVEAAVVYHVADRQRWLDAQVTEVSYAPDAFADEGFIHCCLPQQLEGVCRRYFRGRNDLILLTLDVGSVGEALKFEDTSDAGELFPHVYDRLGHASVKMAQPLTVDADGVPYY
jgi:uncharacterized protein (DUF952 family)